MADQEMQAEIEESQRELRRQYDDELQVEINKNREAINEAEKEVKEISLEFFDGYRIPVNYHKSILFPDGSYNFFEYSRPVITEEIKKQFSTNAVRFHYLKTCRLEFGRAIIRKPESGMLFFRRNYNIYCSARADYLKSHDIFRYVNLHRSAFSVCSFDNWLGDQIGYYKKLAETDKEASDLEIKPGGKGMGNVEQKLILKNVRKDEDYGITWIWDNDAKDRAKYLFAEAFEIAEALKICGDSDFEAPFKGEKSDDAKRMAFIRRLPSRKYHGLIMKYYKHGKQRIDGYVVIQHPDVERLKPIAATIICSIKAARKSPRTK